MKPKVSNVDTTGGALVYSALLLHATISREDGRTFCTITFVEMLSGYLPHHRGLPIFACTDGLCPEVWADITRVVSADNVWVRPNVSFAKAVFDSCGLDLHPQFLQHFHGM